jgi:nucleotide-binding universal stress UspA family protein
MGNIVCATRGGAGSRAVQQAAITYARERGTGLVFLFVIDTSSLENEEAEMVAAVRDELLFLGQTLLRIAKKRAANYQVKAEIIVRDGNVKQQISKFLDESSAELLLLGAPRGTTDTIFGDDVIEQFAESIHRDTGVEVEIIRPA